MYKIGVTGPIASGKTALTRILAGLERTVVVDVDQISRNMYTLDSPVYKQVSHAFRSHGILDQSGHILRRKLGRIVFSSPDHRQTLNNICFPYLKERILEQLTTATGQKLAVIDAGVLLQANWDSLCDEVWTTIVKDEVAIQRIVQRDGLSLAEATDRVRSQIPVEARLQRCKVAFETNGSVPELALKVHTELKRLKHLWD